MARLASAFYNSDGSSGLLNKDAIQCYHLVDLLIDDGALDDLFLTDHVHQISYQSITQGSSKNYDPAGSLIGITDNKETTAVRVGGITLTLAGIEPELTSKIITSTQLINKRVVIYRSFFETNYTAPSTSNTFLWFDGNVKDFSIEEGGTDARISISVASHWADFEKKTGRLTNQATQQLTKEYASNNTFTNDVGFEYSSAMIGDLKWGPRD